MSDWTPYVKYLNILGVLILFGALGLIGRFALLLFSAYQGHPRLVG